MKILEIIPNLSSGGAERFVVDLCNQLSLDDEVTLLTFYDLNDDFGFYLTELHSSVKLITLNKKPGLDLLLIKNLNKVIKDLKPDVIHSHINAFQYVAPFSLFSKSRFFHTVHNDAYKESGSKWNRILRKIFFKSNRIVPITISKESLESFKKLYGRYAPMIYNGRNIDITQVEVSSEVLKEINNFKQSSDSPVIINIARFSQAKRQPLIAKIANRLHKEGFDFTLLFIGRGENPILVNETKSFNDPNIHILGERSNVLEYLKISDGFCLFSSFEGLPISLLEAFATTTIPICTPVGGIKDLIIDGSNGLLSHDISEEECYKTLKRYLLLSPEKKKQLSINALESFTPYSMTQCAVKYKYIFNKYSMHN